MEYMQKWCIVKGCINTRDQGKFIGDLCAPCHEMLTTGEIKHTRSFLAQFKEADKEPEFTSADGTVRKSHYGSGKQPWDIMVEMNIGFEYALACMLKYIRRDSSMKGVDREADLKKAVWYSQRVHEVIKAIDLREPEARRKMALYQELWSRLSHEERFSLNMGMIG